MFWIRPAVMVIVCGRQRGPRDAGESRLGASLLSCATRRDGSVIPTTAGGGRFVSPLPFVDMFDTYWYNHKVEGRCTAIPALSASERYGAVRQCASATYHEMVQSSHCVGVEVLKVTAAEASGARKENKARKVKRGKDAEAEAHRV